MAPVFYYSERTRKPMKPIICDLPAFDKTLGTTGTFITSGQIYQHEVIIKDIKTNAILYRKKSPPNKKLNRFEIPSFPEDGSAVKNGCFYRLCIKVWENQIDAENDVNSYESDDKIIKCVSVPHFQLDIFSEENIYELKSTSMPVGVVYSSDDTGAGDNDGSEKELLNEYYIILSDSEGNHIFKSKTVYDINEKVEINDLENSKRYTVTGYGKTINGMELATAPVTVNVSYEPCKDSSVLSVENDKKNACIKIKSHIRNVLYNTEKPPLFEQHSSLGTHLNLSGNKLKYYDGINVKGSFSLFLKYRPSSLKESILSINNGEIKLNFKTTSAQNSAYKPFFEFYTGNKMVIVEKDEFQNHFMEFMDISDINSRGYEIKIARVNKEIKIKIKDWSDS